MLYEGQFRDILGRFLIFFQVGKQFSNMLDCQAILSYNIITMIYCKNGLYGTCTNVKSQQL